MTDTMTETLTVTVLETATIFEGPDTVYRYDIMATGITEGWAVPAVVDQVKQLGSAHWPEVEVVIDGDETVTEILTKTFITKGIPSYPVETLREHPLPEEEPTAEPLVTRPTKGRTHRHLYGIRPLYLILSALLVGAITGAWVLLGGTNSPPPAMPPAMPPTMPATTGTDIDKQEATPTAGARTTVLMSETFQVEAPYGYTLEDHQDTHLVTGPDPDIRIHIGVDALHGVPAELVREEITRMITADPALQPAPPGEWAGEMAGREAIAYTEDPGDNSAVNWVTWFDHERQISVGCHTRVAPTVIHKAVCRSILETLELR